MAKKAQDWKIPVYPPFPTCNILKRMFEFERLSGGLDNVAEMPLLGRVLGTAALASVIMTLLMSYQWSGAAEPSTAKGHTTSPKMISRHR